MLPWRNAVNQETLNIELWVKGKLDIAEVRIWWCEIRYCEKPCETEMLNWYMEEEKNDGN